MSWEVYLSRNSSVFIKFEDNPVDVSSGLKFHFELKRQPLFLSKLFVYPSIIFVIMAYTSFFIDKHGAPARITVTITNILNAISLMVSTLSYLPIVPYQTWLQSFMMWNLYFAVTPIIEYALLNASMHSYATRKKQIAEMIAEMMAIAVKCDLGEEPGEILQESRKKIQKYVRSTITGGDVL